MTKADGSITATASQESPISQKVEVRIDAKRVRKAFDHAYRDLAKTAQLRGFRRGKAPRSVLERMYGAAVGEQVQQTLIQETIADAIEQADVTPVAAPAIESDPPDADGDFVYTARVEVKPSITLPELEGLPATRPATNVSDADVDAELESLRTRNAPVVEEPEGTEAADGHILSIDFVGRVDGETFEGGTSKDVELEIGAGRFVPGFEEQLVGARTGDDREVRITFPDDYGNAELAGKQAVFDVHVGEVKRRQPPELDDEFAKDMGEEFSTLAELRARIESDLLEGRERAAKAALQRSLMDALIERTEFEVPHGLVDQQLERRLESAVRQMAGSLEESEMRSEVDRLRQQWRPAAEREVREQLLLEAVAEEKAFEASEEDVRAKIESLAREQGIEAAQLEAAVGAEALASIARAQLRDEHALDFLAAAAKVEETTDT
jgi:trigger factor